MVASGVELDEVRAGDRACEDVRIHESEAGALLERKSILSHNAFQEVVAARVERKSVGIAASAAVVPTG